MAQVVRIDTSEYIGYFADLSGPLERGATVRHRLALSGRAITS